MAMRMIKITTCDQKEHTIDIEDVNKMGTIKNIVEDLGEQDVNIPLSEIDSSMFECALKWCRESVHKDEGIPKIYPEKQKFKKQKFDGIDKEIMSKPFEWRAQFLRCVKYLDIPMLQFILHVSMALDIERFISEIPEGTSKVEELRKFLGVVNDFTPEEDVEIQKSVAWIDACYRAKPRKQSKHKH